MRCITSEISEVITVRIDTDEDVLSSIEDAVREQGISHGIILTGVGSIKDYHIHVVETTHIPPGNVFKKKSGPFDVLSITGFIMDGRAHAHISLSDEKGSIGGHLERGCTTLTFCIVSIGVVTGADLTDLDRYRQRAKN